ncbi:MAG: DPP IV N-terminal domain-containing protein [Bacteroidota bacterium]|nr:DPP IV N-terminal domain-containing protein [Bacteroidota bacterium]
MKKILITIASVLLISCTGKQQKEIPSYSAEQFYKNVSLSGGSFSSDENELLVSSNETGIFNVFEINIADGSRRQITSSTTDSYFSIDYVPGTKQILYSADKGGNENSHIYLLKEDGSVTDLTPGDAVKAMFSGWSKDKKTMYFQSNKRDPRFFDLYKMNPGGWKEEMIYKNTEGYDFGGSTKDRSILALVKSISTSENRLFLYNSSSGKITEISEPENPGTYNGSGFSDDKKYFYYTTDAGKEFTYLVSYEISTGNRNVIYETDWDVAMAGLSENDKYRAIVINEDARYVLKIFDVATGKEIQYPTIPGANIVNVNISDSEKLLMLMLGTSKSTGDIYVCRFGDTELKKLTSTMNPEINPDNLVYAQMVRFPSFDGMTIPAVYYKPLTASVRSKVPALVMVHGGPGGQSTIDYNPLIQFLVNHDYAVLAVNNRGSSGYGKTFFKMDDRDH